MAAILLLLVVLLVSESLQQDALEQFRISRDACANETAEILRELDRLQQPEFRCEGQEESLGRSLEALQSSMEEQFASVNSTMAVEMKNNQEKEAERAEQHQLQLQLLNDSILKELKEVDKKLEMVNANAKKFKEQSDFSILEMRRWIASEFSFVKTELQKLSPCLQFKAQLGGLQLKRLGTGFYFYHQTDMPHSAARAWCAERGMRLAQFETLEEMNVVAENAPNNYDYWLGASDVGYAAGDFHWSDGSKVEREFWYIGYPDSHGAGKETCVATRQSAKKLWDDQCTSPWSPLCEVPQEFSSCI